MNHEPNRADAPPPPFSRIDLLKAFSWVLAISCLGMAAVKIYFETIKHFVLPDLGPASESSAALAFIVFGQVIPAVGVFLLLRRDPGKQALASARRSPPLVTLITGAVLAFGVWYTRDWKDGKTRSYRGHYRTAVGPKEAAYFAFALFGASVGTLLGKTHWSGGADRRRRLP